VLVKFVYTSQQAFEQAMQGEVASPSTGGDPSISGPIHLQPVRARLDCSDAHSTLHINSHASLSPILVQRDRGCRSLAGRGAVATCSPMGVLVQRALDMNTGDARERVALPVGLSGTLPTAPEPEPDGYYGGASPGGL
jgi:hypothetical protein